MNDARSSLPSEMELARLFDLSNLDILDTPQEERFDRITNLAARFFETPTALVSLVDQNRQWFKSKIGLEEPETPRSIAICHHAIREEAHLVVNDLSVDPRFKDNPLVKDKGMRFYAGAVLKSVNGNAVGTLCIIDNKPREFSDFDLDSLQKFAAMAEKELNESVRLEAWHKQLLQETLFDPCSKLPGRRLFLEHSRILMSRTHKAAVVVIGINDYALSAMDLSQSEAEQLQSQLAERINELFGDALVSGDLGDGRYCGLFEVESTSDAEPQFTDLKGQVERLKKTFSQPLHTDQHNVLPTVGISLFPDDGMDPEQLLIKADLARPKNIKADSRPIAIFSPDLVAEKRRSVELSARLRDAVANDSLELHYQPKYCLATSEICGVEALLRWKDPILGWIGPDEFIPIAESTGQIEELTRWVMERAWKDLPALRRLLGADDLTVAINLSAQDLLRPGFADWVQKGLDRHNVSGDSVVFEITESSLIENIGQTKRNMMSLKSLGVTFHIDDFGTGYSNLGQLHDLPLDALKVDKRFVSQLGVSTNGEIICKSIINLAKSLSLRVIAEGVETPEQFEALSRLECNAVQGFLMARPMGLGVIGGVSTKLPVAR